MEKRTHPFEEYLRNSALEPFQLSLAAQVRYVTIWNASKGVPITSQHAQELRDAVFRLTGTRYTGDFVLREEPVEEMQTISFKRIVGK